MSVNAIGTIATLGGAVVGGVVGNKISTSEHKTLGTVTGAVAGSVLVPLGLLFVGVGIFVANAAVHPSDTP